MQLLTRTQVTERLGVSASTVERMVRRGDLQKIIIGKRCARITEQSVSDLVERRMLAQVNEVSR